MNETSTPELSVESMKILEKAAKGEPIKNEKGTIINPINEKPVSAKAQGIIERLRVIRNNARRIARSGNPAKRAHAEQAAQQAVGEIRKTYVRDYGGAVK